MKGNCIFAALSEIGNVSEWLKEHAWKVCIRETVSRVRISPFPQKRKPVNQIFAGFFHFDYFLK